MKTISFVIVSLLLPFLGLGQDEASSDLITNVYQLPISWVTEKATANDPFSDPQRRSIRQFLEDEGVEFAAGATVLSGNSNATSIIVRNTREQLEKVESIFEKLRKENAPRQLHLVVEYIEVEAKRYHDWMFENRITGDGTPLRKQAQEWLEKDQATLVEAISITAKSGQRSKIESVNQVIYPTEPGTPEIPNDIQLEGADTEAPIARSVPSAFETRNVGATLEVDPVLGPDNETIDLSLSPEIIQENGFSDWPPEVADPLLSVSLPRFYAMKITTQVTSSHGRYAFIGTTDPLEPANADGKKSIVLTFVRSDVATIAP